MSALAAPHLGAGAAMWQLVGMMSGMPGLGWCAKGGIGKYR